MRTEARAREPNVERVPGTLGLRELPETDEGKVERQQP